MKCTRKYSTDGEGITRYFTKWLWDVYPNTLSKQEMIDKACELFRNPRKGKITKANISFALMWIVKWGTAEKDESGNFKSSANITKIIDVLSKQSKIKVPKFL